MELIVISDSKLKIMLTGEDMRQYSIDCSTLDYENTQTRRAFWSILDEAKHRTGFDAASEKVFVQVYPSKGGGCEMYVTKLGMFNGKADDKGLYDDSEYDVRVDEPFDRGERGVKAMKKSSYITYPENEIRSNSLKNRLRVFKFKEMEMLLSACRRLSLCGYIGESSAYLDKGFCYLLLCGDIGEKTKTRDFLSEYADEISSEAFELYIGEHGRCICESGAISKLSEL
ncbi:MAG: adaptor protein MecA [Clostridia bacterium]|nr:adaptor protein MecA [Clostridia bacterium]